MSETCDVHLPTEKCPLCEGRGWYPNYPGVGGRVPCQCRSYERHTITLSFEEWETAGWPWTAEEYCRNEEGRRWVPCKSFNKCGEIGENQSFYNIKPVSESYHMCCMQRALEDWLDVHDALEAWMEQRGKKLMTWEDFKKRYVSRKGDNNA